MDHCPCCCYGIGCRSGGNLNLGFILLLTFLSPMANYRYLPDEHMKLLQVSYNEERSPERHRQTLIVSVPFFVTLIHENNFCSGTLIGSRVVLTTATCVANIERDQLTHTVIKVGSDVLAGEGQVVPVIDLKVHEYYRRLTIVDNDIALVIVAYTVPFGSRVKKALLVEPEVALRANLPLTMLGWGNEDDRAKEQTYRLVQTKITVMDRAECLKVLPQVITPSTFCAAYRREQPLGDIGGPAMFTTINEELVVVGITSYNGNNISIAKQTVAVITNVSHFHRWIHKNTRGLMSKHCSKARSKDPTGNAYDETV